MNEKTLTQILAALQENSAKQTAILAQLEKSSGTLLEKSNAHDRFLHALFDNPNQLTKIKMYKVYTIDTNVAVDPAKKLANVYQDFGGHSGNLLFVLNQGAGTAYIRLNGATNDPILLTDITNNEICQFIGPLQMDIDSIYYEVATAAAGTARIFVGAWVK